MSDMMSFIYSFQSEWLKKKRSLASWLVFVGAFFTPTIVFLVRIKNYQTLPVLYVSADFWNKLWFTMWESMAVVLLPIGIILATGLITQIEFKNNAWKQLHTTPQRFTTIFFAKFSVIPVMLVEVFVLFNLGIYLTGILPALIFADVPYPSAEYPLNSFFYGSLIYFVECLPILGLQYLISLQFKNFLVPIGVGFLLWFVGIGMISWEYSYFFPYIHAGYDFMLSSGHLKRQLPINLQILSTVYFVVFMLIGYLLYLFKPEKG